MKVVLFCGGRGLRMNGLGRLPKPLIPIGGRPILWHIMKFYAHYGHDDFVLCLGHQADAFRTHFADAPAEDWRVTLVDTGEEATVGERLKAVEGALEGEEYFLATYGDVLTDAPLPTIVADARRNGKVATLLCVRPSYTFHVVELGRGDLVRGLTEAPCADLRINGGYFVFRRDIFDYMGPGEDLVAEPFDRLIARKELLAYPYDGFWRPMDTLKEREQLNALNAAGCAPWRVWDDLGSPKIAANGALVPSYA